MVFRGMRDSLSLKGIDGAGLGWIGRQRQSSDQQTADKQRGSGRRIREEGEAKVKSVTLTAKTARTVRA